MPYVDLFMLGSEARGNDIPDARFGALMRQHDVRTTYTRDRDFRQFRGSECRDPFAAR